MKQKIIYLHQSCPEILGLYCELLGRKELLSENGVRYSESVSASISSIKEYSNGQQMEIEHCKEEREGQN